MRLRYLAARLLQYQGEGPRRGRSSSGKSLCESGMKRARTCAECGRELLPGAPDGFCPACLLGLGAGVLRALAQRPDLSRRRRRALSAAWVLALLAGVPLWLVLAAVLRLW